MTTRRSRNAEHGLERRSLPRRFHNAKHAFEKRGKPIVLPIIALLIALGGWFADQQKFKGGDVYERIESRPSESNVVTGAVVSEPTQRGDDDEVQNVSAREKSFGFSQTPRLTESSSLDLYRLQGKGRQNTEEQARYKSSGIFCCQTEGKKEISSNLSRERSGTECSEICSEKRKTYQKTVRNLHGKTSTSPSPGLYAEAQRQMVMSDAPQYDSRTLAAHPTNAVFHGLTGKGDYYVCERTKVIEFCMRQTQERR